MRNILIISLNYSPAFVSHMLAYGECSEMIGFKAYYLVNDKYLEELNKSVDSEYIVRSVNEHEYSAAIICNVGIKHMIIATQLKFKGVPIFYVFHEPDFSLKRITQESAMNGLKLIVASLCSAYILKNSTKILLPSKFAVKMYEKTFSFINRNYTFFPLLFCNEYSYSKREQELREYFSYIGTATESHNFEKYLEIIKYVAKHEKSIKFCIGTKNDIESYIDADICDLVRSGRLMIKSGRILTNEEINSLTEQSFCVWNAYKISTQSGVLARSFMMGTPVLATEVGSFKEYVKEYYNGAFIKNQNNKELLEKIVLIKENIKSYSVNCHKTFNEIFGTEKNSDKLKHIIDD